MNCRRSIAGAGFMAAVAVALMGCAAQPKMVPVPQLPAGAIEMRVAHVVNPRLPRMDASQLRILLDEARNAAREHFGVDLRFAEPVEIPIQELFDRIPPGQRRRMAPFIYDFKSGKGDAARLEKAFAEDLRFNADPVEEVLQFAGPYLDQPTPATYQALGTALARLQLQRIEHWKKVRALDGGPAIDDSPFNEYLAWTSIGYAGFPYEFVVTNQIIASVEYLGNAAHSAIRGGYTNGLTTGNESSRLRTTSIWSTFAFTADDDWVRQMRGGESYEPAEAARLAGISAVHEIGHQLFHFGHPYGKTACLMNPISMFAYRTQINGLSARDCPIGSSGAMRPGAVKLLVQPQ
jgi:hypothetical protein